jgi:hypothetical protein
MNPMSARRLDQHFQSGRRNCDLNWVAAASVEATSEIRRFVPRRTGLRRVATETALFAHQHSISRVLPRAFPAGGGRIVR